MTPHRYLIDIYNEFREDLQAAEVPPSEVCKRAWFCHVWNHHPELRHITIATGKENFGRCTVCQDCEDRINKARKSGNQAVRRVCAPHIDLTSLWIV